MTSIPLGSLLLRQTPVVLAEDHPERNLSGSEPEVTLAVQDRSMAMNLKEIQALKALLGRAEKHLLLRKEQVLKSKNLTLDLT